PFPLSTRGVSILSAIFFGMIIADVVLRITAHQKRKTRDSLTKAIISRISRCLETMAVFGLFLLFFAYEGIPVLGSRYFLLAWGIGLVVWGVSIAHEAYVRNPAKRAAAIKKGEFSKYFKK
ncbi:MAG: hypothetical protein AAB870_01390, partial [Patescibacteria group bacterium]